MGFGRICDAESTMRSEFRLVRGGSAVERGVGGLRGRTFATSRPRVRRVGKAVQRATSEQASSSQRWGALQQERYPVIDRQEAENQPAAAVEDLTRQEDELVEEPAEFHPQEGGGPEL